MQPFRFEIQVERLDRQTAGAGRDIAIEIDGRDTQGFAVHPFSRGRGGKEAAGCRLAVLLDCAIQQQRIEARFAFRHTIGQGSAGKRSLETQAITETIGLEIALSAIEPDDDIGCGQAEIAVGAGNAPALRRIDEERFAGLYDRTGQARQLIANLRRDRGEAGLISQGNVEAAAGHGVEAAMAIDLGALQRIEIELRRQGIAAR